MRLVGKAARPGGAAFAASELLFAEGAPGSQQAILLLSSGKKSRERRRFVASVAGRISGSPRLVLARVDGRRRAKAIRRLVGDPANVYGGNASGWLGRLAELACSRRALAGSGRKAALKISSNFWTGPKNGRLPERKWTTEAYYYEDITTSTTEMPSTTTTPFVLESTALPTSTAATTTSTMAPTTVAPAIHLPSISCRGPVDVTLLIDTTMKPFARQKAAALAALAAFPVSGPNFGLRVIVFDSQPRLLRPGPNRASLLAQVNELEPSEETPAMAAAFTLAISGQSREAKRMILLLSDGSSGGDWEAMEANLGALAGVTVLAHSIAQPMLPELLLITGCSCRVFADLGTLMATLQAECGAELPRAPPVWRGLPTPKAMLSPSPATPASTTPASTTSQPRTPAPTSPPPTRQPPATFRLGGSPLSTPAFYDYEEEKAPENHELSEDMEMGMALSICRSLRPTDVVLILDLSANINVCPLSSPQFEFKEPSDPRLAAGRAEKPGPPPPPPLVRAGQDADAGRGCGGREVAAERRRPRGRHAQSRHRSQGCTLHYLPSFHQEAMSLR